MDRLVPLGRAFFAIALIGLGTDHFLFGDFVTGRAPPWPEGLPGGRAWAYLTGALFVATGIAVVASRYGRVALLAAAAPIFLWAMLRHIPVAAESAVLSSAWTRAGKSLWLVAGCLTVAATFPPPHHERRPRLSTLLNLDREFVVAGRVCLGLFQILTGIQHFRFTQFVASLIPAWFPGDRVFWTYFGGVALLAGGVGLLVRRTARPAALLSGLMIFSWFFIVHVSRELAGVADGIAVFEALAAAGLLFVLAGQRHHGLHSAFASPMERA